MSHSGRFSYSITIYRKPIFCGAQDKNSPVGLVSVPACRFPQRFQSDALAYQECANWPFQWRDYAVPGEWALPVSISAPSFMHRNANILPIDLPFDSPFGPSGARIARAFWVLAYVPTAPTTIGWPHLHT